MGTVVCNGNFSFQKSESNASTSPQNTKTEGVTWNTPKRPKMEPNNSPLAVPASTPSVTPQQSNETSLAAGPAQYLKAVHCSACQHYFTKEEHYSQHIVDCNDKRTGDSNSREFLKSCRKCSRKFKTRGVLLKHLSICNTNNYACWKIRRHLVPYVKLKQLEDDGKVIGDTSELSVKNKKIINGENFASTGNTKNISSSSIKQTKQISVNEVQQNNFSSSQVLDVEKGNVGQPSSNQAHHETTNSLMSPEFLKDPVKNVDKKGNLPGHTTKDSLKVEEFRPDSEYSSKTRTLILCKNCKYYFLKQANYDEHIYECFSLYRHCNICSRRFSTFKSLLQHMLALGHNYLATNEYKQIWTASERRIVQLLSTNKLSIKDARLLKAEKLKNVLRQSKDRMEPVVPNEQEVVVIDSDEEIAIVEERVQPSPQSEKCKDLDTRATLMQVQIKKSSTTTGHNSTFMAYVSTQFPKSEKPTKNKNKFRSKVKNVPVPDVNANIMQSKGCESFQATSNTSLNQRETDMTGMDSGELGNDESCSITFESNGAAGESKQGDSGKNKQGKDIETRRAKETIFTAKTIRKKNGESDKYEQHRAKETGTGKSVEPAVKVKAHGQKSGEAAGNPQDKNAEVSSRAMAKKQNSGQLTEVKPQENMGGKDTQPKENTSAMKLQEKNERIARKLPEINKTDPLQEYNVTTSSALKTSINVQEKGKPSDTPQVNTCTETPSKSLEKSGLPTSKPLEKTGLLTNLPPEKVGVPTNKTKKQATPTTKLKENVMTTTKSLQPLIMPAKPQPQDTTKSKLQDGALTMTNLSKQSTPTSKVPLQSTAPTSKVPQQSTSTSKVPQQSTPTSKVPQQSTPTSKVPQQSTPTSKVPQQSTPTSKVPQQSTPTSKEPLQSTIPTSKVPQQSTPTSKVPQQCTAPTSKVQEKVMTTTTPSHQVIATCRPEEATPTSKQQQTTISTSKPEQQVAPTTKPQDKVIPPSEVINTNQTQDKVIPVSKIQDKVMTTSNQQDKVMASSKIENIVMPARKTHDTVIITNKAQDKVMFTTKPQDKTMFTMQPQDKTMFTMQPQDKTMFTTQPQDKTMFTTQPQDKTMFTMQPQDKIMFTTQPQDKTMFTTQPQDETMSITKPQDKTMFTTKPQDKTMSTTKSQDNIMPTMKPQNKVLPVIKAPEQIIPTSKPQGKIHIPSNKLQEKKEGFGNESQQNESLRRISPQENNDSKNHSHLSRKKAEGKSQEKNAKHELKGKKDGQQQKNNAVSQQKPYGNKPHKKDIQPQEKRDEGKPKAKEVACDSERNKDSLIKQKKHEKSHERKEECRPQAKEDIGRNTASRETNNILSHKVNGRPSVIMCGSNSGKRKSFTLSESSSIKQPKISIAKKDDRQEVDIKMASKVEKLTEKLQAKEQPTSSKNSGTSTIQNPDLLSKSSQIQGVIPKCTLSAAKEDRSPLKEKSCASTEIPALADSIPVPESSLTNMSTKIKSKKDADMGQQVEKDNNVDQVLCSSLVVTESRAALVNSGSDSYKRSSIADANYQAKKQKLDNENKIQLQVEKNVNTSKTQEKVTSPKPESCSKDYDLKQNVSCITEYSNHDEDDYFDDDVFMPIIDHSSECVYLEDFELPDIKTDEVKEGSSLTSNLKNENDRISPTLSVSSKQRNERLSSSSSLYSLISTFSFSSSSFKQRNERLSSSSSSSSLYSLVAEPSSKSSSASSSKPTNETKEMLKAQKSQIKVEKEKTLKKWLQSFNCEEKEVKTTKIIKSDPSKYRPMPRSRKLARFRTLYPNVCKRIKVDGRRTSVYLTNAIDDCPVCSNVIDVSTVTYNIKNRKVSVWCDFCCLDLNFVHYQNTSQE